MFNPFDRTENDLLDAPRDPIETGGPAIGLPLVLLQVGVILFLAAVLP